MGIPRPALGLKKNISKKDPFNLKQEWVGECEPSSWDVKGDNLCMVPWEYPLERTHREIVGDASAIAKRISECLRTHSIEAKFCPEKAKASCKTTDYVCFRIRMYAGGENGQPVIVEVQRRNGSSSSFMKTCRAILDAAEAKNSVDKKALRTIPWKPVSQLKCVGSVRMEDDDHEADAANSLSAIVEMMKSDKKGINLLALENLTLLTDSMKTKSSVAHHVAKWVLLGNETYDMREDIRILVDRDVFVDESDDDKLTYHDDRLRYQALYVLANASELCFNASLLTRTVQSDRWFRESLIPSLIDEVRRAETNANNAYQSTRCLAYLMAASPSALISFSDNGFAATIEKGRKVGKMHHELLAVEAERCLELLRHSAGMHNMTGGEW